MGAPFFKFSQPASKPHPRPSFTRRGFLGCGGKPIGGIKQYGKTAFYPTNKEFMVKKTKTIGTYRNKIKRVLEDANMYSPTLDFAIEDLAQVSHLKDIAFSEATGYIFHKDDPVNREVKNSSIVMEVSREGAIRYKANPAYGIYLDLVRESQKILDGLCMTAKSSNLIQGDEFDELRARMEEAANG